MKNNLSYLLLNLVLICTVISFGQNIDFTKEEQKWISEHPVIEYGYDPNWEPYEIYKDGIYTGIVGDYVSIIEEKTGIKMVPIPNSTWSESLQKLKNGEIHVLPSCAVTEERRKFLDFTNVYIEDPMVIVTLNNSEYISSLDDLHGKTVALPTNYYTTELIKKDHPEIIILEKTNVQECLDQVSYGNAIAFIGNLGVVTYNINNRGYNNLKIAAPTGYKNNGIALAVTKDWTIFRDITQKVFNSINQKEKSAIKNNWIAVNYEYGIATKTFIQWIFGIVGVFSTILLIFYLWNKSLKKQINLRTKSEEKLQLALTAINEQNSEKEILLQEIHHRVKNNLQIITSLLRLQANASKDENATISLNNATERIRAISLIHEKIYSSTNLGQITIIDYVNSLANEIISSVSDHPIELDVKSTVDSINLKSIVPLALILNELLTNSIKYGLKDKKDGEICIEFTRSSTIHLRYFDNGMWIENVDSDFFGTTLLEVFTEQLEGDFILNKSDKGTEYLFNFKEIF